MGCGVSKGTKYKMDQQNQKIEELIEVNGQLAQQIAELKDLKSKRKPIYVVHDQEIDDLYVFQTDLDKKFAKLEEEINRIRNQVQMKPQNQIKKKSLKPFPLDEIQDEEQWMKMMREDNDITIKPFNDPAFELESEKLDNKEQEPQIEKVLEDLNNEQLKDPEATLPKPQEKERSKRSVQDIQKSLADVLDDQEIRNLHEGIKNRIFRNPQPISESAVIVKLDSNLVESQIPPTERQTKNKKNTFQQPKSSTQQQFYSKQYGQKKQNKK
ncbi:hypothetical protein pb186bvf_001896 [Paramecium bursaria]